MSPTWRPTFSGSVSTIAAMWIPCSAKIGELTIASPSRPAPTSMMLCCPWIRKILRTQGQHNIMLVGAGRLGEAIVSSPIFAEHGIHIAAIVDTDPEKVGRQVGDIGVSNYGELNELVRDKNIIVGVLAVPATSAQEAAEDLVDSGVKIIFNYSEALLDVPSDVAVHTSNPAVDLLYALYFHLT